MCFHRASLDKISDMSALIFDGVSFSRMRERFLRERVKRVDHTPRIASLYFVEDPGSVLYTRLKKQAAVRVGIEFSEHPASMSESAEVLRHKIRIMSEDDDVCGVLVQKPTKHGFATVIGRDCDVKYENWWKRLTAEISPEKDVDCLTRHNLDLIYVGKWRVVPATVKAIITVLNKATIDLGILPGQVAGFDLYGYCAVIVGRSELVGKPLASLLRQYGANVKLFGSDLDLDEIQDADIVVSATGRHKLIKADMIKEGAVVVDVGAPKADVDTNEVVKKAGFLSPVPGGVGPVTVVSLLENLVDGIEAKGGLR